MPRCFMKAEMRHLNYILNDSFEKEIRLVSEIECQNHSVIVIPYLSKLRENTQKDTN